MQILSNNVAILEDDEALSRYVREAGSLILDSDVACGENLLILSAGDWVVDGGAAIGDHTAAYIKKVGPGGKVFAFEPNPRYVECLKYNCPTAIIHPFGLSDENGPCRMHVGIGGNMGAGHITPQGEVQTCTIKLDDIKLERLNLLKLDVEGFELRALRGSIETVRKCRPIIQIEWNPEAMQRAGIVPNDVLLWFKHEKYRYNVFAGTIEQGGEIMANPL